MHITNTSGCTAQERARGHKSPADPHFFDDVAHALEGAHEILVMGPAQTKQEFAATCGPSIRRWGRAIVGVENADHPSDAEVLAYARRHFKAIDRMFTPGA